MEEETQDGFEHAQVVQEKLVFHLHCRTHISKQANDAETTSYQWRHIDVDTTLFEGCVPAVM